MNEDVFPIEHGDFPMSFLVFRGVIMLENGRSCFFSRMANQPNLTPPFRNEGLIAGLIKGNQYFISPDHI